MRKLNFQQQENRGVWGIRGAILKDAAGRGKHAGMQRQNRLWGGKPDGSKKLGKFEGRRFWGGGHPLHFELIKGRHREEEKKEQGVGQVQGGEKIPVGKEMYHPEGGGGVSFQENLRVRGD